MKLDSVASLVQLIRDFNYQPAASLTSIVLVGGKGTRLADRRKQLSPEYFPTLEPRYWNISGPKGLAIFQAKINNNLVAKPLTDWHLDIHCACDRINGIALSLGYQAELLKYYYETKYHSSYKKRTLNYLIEKNPAGTLAPLVELCKLNALPSTPLIYANGDSLIDIELYEAYLEGLKLALQANLDLQRLIIIIATLIPLEQASDYGIIEFNPDTGLVSAFREKNTSIIPHTVMLINHQKYVPINAGFSIINNPKQLLDDYLTPEIMEISSLLNEGLLDYQQYEQIVKYETLYGKIAADGHIVTVLSPNHWCDLGTEARISLAETSFINSLNRLNASDFGLAL